MHTQTRIAMTLSIVLASALPLAQAGNGPGAGAGAGGGSIAELSNCGEISGSVANVGSAGGGYEIIDESAVSSILYGLGPSRYWESLGTSLPTVGESIAADVCDLTFANGDVKTVAMSVSVEGEDAVQLRDEETGLPLWRQARQGK